MARQRTKTKIRLTDATGGVVHAERITPSGGPLNAIVNSMRNALSARGQQLLDAKITANEPVVVSLVIYTEDLP